MKEKILNFMNKQTYKALSTSEIAKVLLSNEDSFNALTKALFELERSGEIAKNKQGKYQLTKRMGMLRGTFDAKAAGYGFLLPEDEKHADVYIPRDETMAAMAGDTVLVKITNEFKGRYEGAVIKILDRKLKQIVGEYFQGAVFLKKSEADMLFRVRKNEISAKDHDLVVAKIDRVNPRGIIDVSLVEIIAKGDDEFYDILEVLARNEIKKTFPEEVLQIAQSLPQTANFEDRPGTVDLRNEIIFTIDGDDTKDIDDAVSIAKLSNNHYRLKVHIADVSSYVLEDSPLDKEAFERSTSVYIPGSVIPMLPRELSNGICSLNPDVDRFTLTCDMEIDQEGSVVKYDIYPSIIHSVYQMTYNKCNAILDGDTALQEQYSNIVSSLFMMRELATILKDVRSKEGSIDFDTIEPKIVFAEDGSVKDIKVRDRGVSEGIIEEFMLVANQVVATHVHSLELPFIYRIHEDPDPSKLETLFQLARELGYMPSIPKKIHRKDLQKLLDKVDGTRFEKVINVMMLRSMAKAKYSENNVGHYGLAFENYTHFTSPIRRYPDLIVHRYLRDYFFLHKTDSKSIRHKEEQLPSISEQTSKKERQAMMCEREVTDMKKAEYMMDKIGEEFDAVISSVLKFGMFVELENTVEGLVHISTFKEAMEYIEEKMMFLGISSRIEYNIGMVVRVKCVKADKQYGKVDFELVTE